MSPVTEMGKGTVPYSGAVAIHLGLSPHDLTTIHEALLSDNRAASQHTRTKIRNALHELNARRDRAPEVKEE